jgi:hypothetical protein
MARSRKERRLKGDRPQRHAPVVRRSRTLLKALVGLLAVVVVSGVAVYLLLAFAGDEESGPKTAAIVDQLSLTQPNPDFAETTTSILESAGYSVDYYPGEEVTVEFYRDLPTHGYDLILLRVHSGLARDYGEPTGYVSLFSGQPFSESEYAEERAAGLVGRATYYDGGPSVFGIVPDFIESTMKGRFDGATVLMLGCDGLITDTTAEAFVRKGAKVVVGWDGRVSAEHTDAAAEQLLRHLLADGLGVEVAVARTMAELGPDPDFESRLLVYPSKG